MIKKWLWIVCCMGFLLQAKRVYAIEYTQINGVLQEIFPEDQNVDFQDLVDAFLHGNWNEIYEWCKSYVSRQFFYELQIHKKSVIQAIGIVLMGTLFTNLSMAFTDGHVSNVGFYVIYMLLFTLLLSTFYTTFQLISQYTDHILNFMTVFMPVLSLAVTLTGKIQTSIMFRQVLFFGITLIHWILRKTIFSCVYFYTLIGMVNQLSKEDMLSKFGEALKTGIAWILKSILCVVLGFNLIQSLIMPSLDVVQRGWASRLTKAIPGVGDVMETAVTSVLGASILLKNGIGIAGMVVLAVLCVIPMLKLGALSLLYVFVQALIQPVADPRIVKMFHCVTQGLILLMKTVGTIFVLFFVSIAILLMTTQGS